MGKAFKKILITTGIVTLMLMSGCSKKDSVTAESTQITMETTDKDLNIGVNVDVAETVSKELAEQASREVEQMGALEAEGTVVYDDVSGDIVNHKRGMTDQDEAIMNRIRQDVVDGVTRGSVIEEEVEMWCSDFLDDEQKDEFISELHLLEKDEAEVVVQPKETKASTKAAPKETQSPQPKETQASNPKQTQPAPQETQPVPQETQPVPQPTQSTYNAGDTVYSGEHGSVQMVVPDENQHLSPEENEAINNIEFN